MNIRDKAIILKKRNIKESLAIITVLTQSYGIFSGIIKNTHSKRNIITYQVGNIVNFYWNARLDEHLGIINCELIKSYSHLIMSNKYNLFYIQSLIELTLYSFKERESHVNLFKEWLTNLESINDINIKNYINFELLILKEAGYSLNLNRCGVTNSTKNLIYVSPKSGQAISAAIGEAYKHKLLLLPQFLINCNCKPESTHEIQAAFNLTAYFFNKYILIRKKLPVARELLLKTSVLNYEN
ncbi:DNA repair protein RecO [Orientia chuto str. Dubai]|uniref:DNA repair protein RecO n=1 Tax=Orientia chuto str. Dubai TaxID=1359168 RepID=A0A0F3MIC1_9RICK|nr:DNA repair protein RecO [Candidatus Orientia mediorientalis]KJV55505.1 DNA repair protein RecO [Orientia chuto str. Dubai]